MTLSKIFLLLALLLLASCQAGFNKNFANAIKTIRKSLSQVSLVGNWKFLQDSNFVINKKITMINEVGSQIMRNNDKLSFISSDSTFREAEAYFDSDKDKAQPKTLYIELYDGLYYTNNTVALEIDLRQLQASHRSDGNTNLWNNTKPIIVVCMLVQNKQIIAQISTYATIEIFTNTKQTDLTNQHNRFFVKFQSKTFSFYLELKYVTDQYSKFANLMGVSTFLFFILIACYKPKKQLYNISEWMILQAFGFTIVASWIFIRVSLEKIDTSMKFVGLCAFVNFILAFFFLRNYEEVLKSFKLTYERIAFLSALLGYFLLCYLFEESLTFWIFQSFCLIALQINYSYSIGGRGGLSVVLVLTLFFMRIPYFYYRLESPQITREPSDYKALGIFIITNAALLIFIIMQRYFGSRFMIPKELIPDYFNYFQRIAVGEEALEEVCPICTLKLKQQSGLEEGPEQNEEVDLEQSEQEPQAQTQAAINEIKVMVTPCNHKYHPKCLQVWIQNRLICPYCRSVLPPSQTQRDDSYCC